MVVVIFGYRVTREVFWFYFRGRSWVFRGVGWGRVWKGWVRG